VQAKGVREDTHRIVVSLTYLFKKILNDDDIIHIGIPAGLHLLCHSQSGQPS
jgi:hypothetical protein